jgi:hypothetical protein
MNNHPNAKAATITTALAAGAVYLAARYGYTLSSEWSLLAAGAVVSGVLFIGRRGIKGVISDLWNGAGSVWSGKPPENK